MSSLLCWTSSLLLPIIPWGIMLTRSYRSQESLVKYWAMRAVELSYAIDDVSMTTLVEHAGGVLEAIRTMEAERRVMVIGGEACGKSTLLAGLAGSPLLAQVPLEAPYVRWRFRNADGHAEHSRFIPLQQMEGLEFVDSRSCASAETAEALRTIMPGTDVLIAVVDGRNPGASPVWELLLSEEAAGVGVAMLAVTFANSPQVSDALRDLCQERLGRSLPVYCVNPSSEPAMEVFCERVQDALDSTHGLRAAIRQVVEASVDLTYKQGSALKTLEAKDRTNSGFIRRIEEEIDYFLSRQQANLPRLMDVYTEASRRALPRLLCRLRWVYGWVFSPVTILRLEVLGVGCERFLYFNLRDEVLRLQMDSDRHFIVSCAGHWKSARPRMQQELGCEIGEFPEETLALELARLRERLGRELYAPFTREQMRHNLAVHFIARAGWMRACLTFICLFLFFAGLLGLLGQDVPAVFLAGVAVIIWMGASIGHMVAGRRIRNSIEAQGKVLENAVRVTLSESVERLVVSRVAAYRRLYALPRRKVDELEGLLKPLQEELQNIIRQIRAAAVARS